MKVGLQVLLGSFSYDTASWALKQGATSLAFRDALICISFLDDVVRARDCQ